MLDTKGMKEAVDRQKWIIEKQRLPEGRQRKNEDGEVQLLWPVKDFVLNYNSRKIREECQLGGQGYF